MRCAGSRARWRRCRLRGRRGSEESGLGRGLDGLGKIWGVVELREEDVCHGGRSWTFAK